MNKISFLLLAGIITVTACNSSVKNNNATDTTTVPNDSTTTDITPLLQDSTLSNWHNYGKTTVGKAWKLKDGLLHLDASKKADWQSAEGGDIVTNDEYENFHLKVEWKISRAGNSGIMFYVHEDTAKYQYPWQTGPETQIADNKENEDGKLIKHRAGDLYDLISISKEVVKPAGEWNKTEVIANKGQLDILVNDEKVLSTTMWDDNWKKLVAGSKFKEWPGFGTYKKGHIALQDHGADVWFRNVEIKKL
ncbi:DUF1080 domain-containing protein [Mucilaginibacter terrigena]|uniref:DUF1080 domain-containing protein n=1 Tax=Mucilaginibacter terrigena TaxID=2492395 RepID=A0A4Q5LGZ3_9SPHI|nr:DUF1080 domain-containing protein [Mucilaginibacter terrigena]RYU86490.1 DUF1080 domain-containing protein [Mucilaginibacter terrigena]